MTKKIALVSAILMVLGATQAMAIITMHVDSDAKKFWFSGSTTGSLYVPEPSMKDDDEEGEDSPTMFDVPGEDAKCSIIWHNTEYGQGPSSSLNIPNAFSISKVDADSCLFLIQDDGHVELALTWHKSRLPATNGVFIEAGASVYSFNDFGGALDAAACAKAINACIGHSLTLTLGSSFEPIAVVASTLPKPESK